MSTMDEPVNATGSAAALDVQDLEVTFHRRGRRLPVLKGVTLKMESGSLPSLLGDIDRLEQVFSNLLDNALKHTPAGGTVTVSARQSSSGDLRVCVADTGPGIPADELPHVFERFYQADPAERKAGTGLGLAIAREIARAHGGDIEARSPAAGGAEFIVRLPLGRAG